MEEEAPRRSGVLSCSFNQNHSCFAIGTREGYRIFDCESCKCCYEKLDGAVGCIEMLFTTSILALVGAGEQPALSPRRLCVVNTATDVKKMFDFVSAVLAVRWNMKRIVILLEKKVYIRELPQLNSLDALDVAENKKGLCAFSSNQDNCYLALPASSDNGSVLLYDALNLTTLGQFQAHKSPLAAMTLSDDGSLLATASEQGTVIRVHLIPQARKLFTFRRGTYAATIYSLSFGPSSLSPQLLAATSSRGTLHVYRLSHPTKQGVSVTDLLAAVMPDAVSDFVEPELHYAGIRHGLTPGIKSVCAVVVPEQQCTMENPAGSSSTTVRGNHRAGIFVVTFNGLFNEYYVSTNSKGEGVCSLERECSLLTNSSEQICARYV